jgi:hypothetical protein
MYGVISRHVKKLQFRVHYRFDVKNTNSFGVVQVRNAEIQFSFKFRRRVLTNFRPSYWQTFSLHKLFTPSTTSLERCVLLFLSHSFAFDIKASLVTGSTFFFHKSSRYSETGISLRISSILWSEKDFLFVRHENSFVFTHRQWRTHASLTVYFYQLHDYLSLQRTE